MEIYVVTTNYMSNYLFGTYSSVEKAKKAIIDFYKNNPELYVIEQVDNCAYCARNTFDENFWFGIYKNILDED